MNTLGGVLANGIGIAGQLQFEADVRAGSVLLMNLCGDDVMAIDQQGWARRRGHKRFPSLGLEAAPVDEAFGPAGRLLRWTSTPFR